MLLLPFTLCPGLQIAAMEAAQQKAQQQLQEKHAESQVRIGNLCFFVSDPVCLEQSALSASHAKLAKEADDLRAQIKRLE